MEPRASTTFILRVASKNGGVDGETDADSNRKCAKIEVLRQRDRLC